MCGRFLLHEKYKEPASKPLAASEWVGYKSYGEAAACDAGYAEKFERVADAFKREKQVQGWSRAKKEAGL
jgi:hypothetical protein